MKNMRSFRLPAFVLAVVLMICAFTLPAFAENVIGAQGNVIQPVTNLATVSYTSGGKAVGSVADMDPNKENKMTLAVSGELVEPVAGKIRKMLYVLPGDVIVTSADALACTSDQVRCEYNESANCLLFSWKNAGAGSFTATLTVRPKAAATRKDVSGSRVLVVNNFNDNGSQPVAVNATLKNYSGVNRLTGTIGQLYDNRISASSDLTVWQFERVSGDWYSISTNGQYLNFGNNGNNISLTSTPQYFLYTTEGAGEQFVAFDKNGTHYYLNNKSKNVSNGIQASTYNDQNISLYTKLTPSGNEAFVAFSTNGGSSDASLQSLLVQKGDTIALPAYSGTKNGYEFVGWAEVSNNKQNKYYKIYQPGETYTVNSAKVTLYAIWSNKAGEKVQFGIRLSGDIPDEPAQYPVSEYSKEHHYIENDTVKTIWVVDTNATGQPVEGNHVVNAVTRNLKKLPTDAEIKAIYPSYDPETMYVHWYVMKYAGQWKVDGVVIKRDQTTWVKYSANVETEEKKNIKNVPASYSVNQGTTVKIGADKDGKQLNNPVYPGYTFLGWSTSPDGEVEFQNKENYTVDSNITLYACWEKIKTYEVSYSIQGAPESVILPETKDYKKDEKVTIAGFHDFEDYIFSGWMDADGNRIDSNLTIADQDVEITGKYYGPITVTISSDWEAGKVGFEGAVITLTAVVNGPKELNLDYALQWQYKGRDGSWVDVQGATGYTLTYDLDEETSARVWRVVVTDAWPHQD